MRNDVDLVNRLNGSNFLSLLCKRGIVDLRKKYNKINGITFNL